jgi:hypothetical protein
MIADEAAAEAAEVEELVPVGAVAGQPRDIVGEYDPDIAEGDAADQLGEADPPARRAGGLAQVAIDDVDRGLRPAAGNRLQPEVILQPQALLMANDLLGGGLADVDHGPAVQVGRRDEVGAGHGAPPAEGSRWLPGWAVGPLPGLASRRSEARPAWLPPVGHEAEDLPDGIGRDPGPGGRAGAISGVGRGGGDAEDDAIAVLDLKGPRLTRRAVLNCDAEGAAAERMEGIDDGDGQR